MQSVAAHRALCAALAGKLSCACLGRTWLMAGALRPCTLLCSCGQLGRAVQQL